MYHAKTKDFKDFLPAFKTWCTKATTGIISHKINQRTNGPIAHLRLSVLSKLTVTLLKNETYGYGKV